MLRSVLQHSKLSCQCSSSIPYGHSLCSPHCSTFSPTWCHASSEVVKDGPRAWALAQAGQIWMKLLASTFNLLQLSQPAGKDGLSVSLSSPLPSFLTLIFRHINKLKKKSSNVIILHSNMFTFVESIILCPLAVVISSTASFIVRNYFLNFSAMQ